MLRKVSRPSFSDGMQRIEISDVPIERMNTVKTDIPVQMLRTGKKCGFNLGKTRTVRSVTQCGRPAAVKKAFVCIDSDDVAVCPDSPKPKPKDTVLDKILRRLQLRQRWKHPVILIITPSRHHKTQHKLHVVDRVAKIHLGMTTIKRKELLQLKQSNAFEKHCIVVSTKYINLRKMAVETAIIPNIINAVNLQCCCGKKCVHEKCRQNIKTLYPKNPTEPICSSSKSGSQVQSTSAAAQPPQYYPNPPTKPICSSSKSGSQVQSTSTAAQPPQHRHYKRRCTAHPSHSSIVTIAPTPTPTTTTNTMSSNNVPSNSFIRKQSEQLFDSWSDFRIMDPRQKLSFMKLVKRINASSQTSSCYFEDLQTLFDMIKHYNVKVFIRPELVPKAVADEEEFLRCRLPRYNIECFILGASYIGGIILDSEQLEQQLLRNGDILPQVKVITDVCEITPLPRIFFLAIRTLCELLCLELLYDAFGEFIFSLYNKID